MTRGPGGHTPGAVSGIFSSAMPDPLGPPIHSQGVFHAQVQTAQKTTDQAANYWVLVDVSSQSHTPQCPELGQWFSLSRLENGEFVKYRVVGA